ncbi:hypothetical protein M569_14731, partial [Genlisea aurea]
MVLWVFGYGSLIWKAGFEFDESIVGFVKDYKRAFDLACIDHMGTPEQPGRTLTLHHEEGAICWGVAYRARQEKAAMAYLEQRESEYDKKTPMDFYKGEPEDKPWISGVMVFTSTPDSAVCRYYLGPAPMEEMAKQIAASVGPCGKNRNYLFRLEKALLDIIRHQDDYVTQLATRVKEIL